MTTKEIKVDPTFKDLIPPLNNDEYSALEKSIREEGCRDAIVLWNDTIIDGHNRYEICTKHGIAFNTATKQFDSQDHAKLWMINNQFSRRNLNDWQRFGLGKAAKEILLEMGAKERVEAKIGNSNASKTKLSDSDKDVLPTTNYERHKNEHDLYKKAKKSFLPKLQKASTPPPKAPEQRHNTQKVIAKDLGWSTGKVAKADVVDKKAPEEIKHKLEKGEISIDRAYREVKAKERKAQIQQQKAKIEEAVKIELASEYNVVVIDPPWAYGRQYDPETSRVANPYPEMSQQQLLKMDIPFADDCVLFLWTTHAFIWDAKQLMDKWGFSYKANLVWDKQKMGMGAWFRMQCEFCLVGIKGKPFFNNTSWRDIIQEPRREHSRKPEMFYKMVNEITAGKKLDYFSRQNREGWDVFGNETEKFK